MTEPTTPCGPVPDRCDAEAGEPCGFHEREQAHAEGEHCFCGSECTTAPSPVDQSPIREQLLNSIDATFCQSLGYGTPEGLLAAYEASRTQTVDREALRKLIAAALRRAPFKELRADWSAPNGPLEITARVDDLADAALTAVLPATANHNTDTSADRLERVREWVTSDIRDLLNGSCVADETAATDTARGCPPDCPCRAVCIGTLKPAAGARQDGVPS